MPTTEQRLAALEKTVRRYRLMGIGVVTLAALALCTSAVMQPETGFQVASVHSIAVTSAIHCPRGSGFCCRIGRLGA